MRLDRYVFPERMSTQTLFVATLLLLSLVAGLAPTADARELPPVCGEFYNWCEDLVDDTVDTAREALCEMEAPCLP